MSIKEWIEGAEMLSYKGHQLRLIDNVLEKCWSWQITGNGDDGLWNRGKQLYFMNILSFLDLPNEATALDVGGGMVIRKSCPETGVEKMIGFGELENRAKELAGELGRLRPVHYSFDGQTLHKFTFNAFDGQEYEITLAGLKNIDSQ